MTATAHRVLITIDEAFLRSVAGDRLTRIALGVLNGEKAEECELGIVVTDDETVRRLNREYAGDDHATDVLSFSLREGEEFVAAGGPSPLGEVIVSYPTAERQAADAGHSVEDELSHLLVHGILHLLGYDHAEPADERKMMAREEALLGRAHGH
jgi:probable rRNA maturation factor